MFGSKEGYFSQKEEIFYVFGRTSGKKGSTMIL
jgi:hypothetical protein